MSAPATKAQAPPAYTSGFCGLRLPASRHARCPQVVGPTICACACHRHITTQDALDRVCRFMCQPDRHDPACHALNPRRHLKDVT